VQRKQWYGDSIHEAHRDYADESGDASRGRERKALIQKIISGGQTGVDRAALDFALAHQIPCGGWCPRGRIAEDGPIAAHYPLRETPDREYRQRTQYNVRDSDGTLILSSGPIEGGTAATSGYARDLDKPYLVLDLDSVIDMDDVCDWLLRNQIRVLNIAGPRESKVPGIHDRTANFLNTLYTVIARDPAGANAK